MVRPFVFVFSGFYHRRRYRTVAVSLRFIMDVCRSHDGIRQLEGIPVLKKVLISVVAAAAATLGVVGVAHADTLGDHGVSSSRSSDSGNSSYGDSSDSDSNSNDNNSDDNNSDYDNNGYYNGNGYNNRDSGGLTNGGLTGGNNGGGLLGGLGN